jgi:FkbM family methyltransferase
MRWKAEALGQLKRVPPVFDAVKRMSRRIGSRTPVYESLSRIAWALPENAAFIQIGSNDGISIDPIREFVVANPGWHGAFVEPVPRIFATLRRNYSYLRNRDFTFFNAAVSSGDGTKQLWKIRDASLHEFAPFASALASFDRNHLLRHFAGHPDLDAKIEAVPVPCMSYDEIRTKAQLSEVHLLHLDVEGHEAQILGAIDFSNSRPMAIVFEISHMAVSMKHEVFENLLDHGYKLMEAGADCVATRLAA